MNQLLFSVVLLFAFFVVSNSFSVDFWFECDDFRPMIASVEGAKIPTGWRVYCESLIPPGVGSSGSCTEDSTGNILNCQINWYNTTTPEPMMMTYDPVKQTVSATLITTDLKTHVFNNCRYGSNNSTVI
eukprot:TRINITY_DN204_c0_g1_i1.p1 TRINITY_DN204_c0_g1~~TRINITY_DN204_c0_g1_i1.p1  ORF type:complete len:143 (-),score=25.06 TRINITY_DN204_c0_g1_i1:73-459(-)